MKTIAHLSDLHFNRVDPVVVVALEKLLLEVRPDVLAISGDVSQRARSIEFLAFQSFIERIPFPRVVVPGNHDIPLFDLFRRFASPLRRFRRLVEANPFPIYEDPHLFLIGVNSTRSFTVSGGKLSDSRLRGVTERLAQVGSEKMRVLICHHPVQSSDGNSSHSSKWIRGIEKITERVDLVLSGHLHQAESEVLILNPGPAEKNRGVASTLLVRAGTAVSTRQRGEANSFNLIRVKQNQVTIEVMVWDDLSQLFRQRSELRYRCAENHWIAETEI